MSDKKTDHKIAETIVKNSLKGDVDDLIFSDNTNCKKTSEK